MNKKKQHIVPALRFPEFEDDGDWEVEDLSELGSLINGLTYSPKDVREEGLLVLRSSNVQNGQILLDDCVYVKPDIKGANISKPNDILICVRNGSKRLIGKNAIIPENLPLATHGAFMTMFRANNPSFVFQLFQTDSYSKQVKADLGATINSINGKNFIKYEFTVPPTPKEQEKIANCLSSLDTLISAETDKLAHLQDHKKGLLQQLFPKAGETKPQYRFPEFVNDGDWEEKLLGEVGEFIGGGTPSTSTPEFWGGNIIWYTPTEVKNGVLKQSTRTITKLGLNKSSAKLLPKGTILITTRATIGDVAITLEECCTNQGFQSLNVNKSEVNTFWYYWILKNKSELVKKATGSTFKEIGKTDIKQIESLSPTKEEQEKIANCLSSVDDLIAAQSSKIESLQAHKKGLMQQLFPTLSEP